jgi:predicted HAD superfamily Cof-like phosphohydrolase
VPDTERTADSGDTGSRIAGQVDEFHRLFELPIARTPGVDLADGQAELRQALIDEETSELRAAVADRDIVSIADALADIVYVAYGTACVYGIDLDAVLDEVHASNMTKLGADGRPVRRADGKVLKGPGYRPPNIAAVLRCGR